MYKFILHIGYLVLFFSWGCNSSKKGSQISLEKDSFPYLEWTIEQYHTTLKEEQITALGLTDAYLNRIAALDDAGPQLNAIIELNPDARTIASQLDQDFKNGIWRGPLHGVPVLLKDNIDTHDKMSTTAGSRALTGSKPLKDSEIAKQLRQAGAIILGKTNLSEWANFRGQKSSSGWSGLGGQTKNPYQTKLNPCGSSSGSGVAVSANFCLLAVGTETNGSIVCPASANGVVGIKPTVGLLSRSGVIPISFTQDTPGPMARTVKDAALGLGAMASIDEKDNKTLQTDRVAYTDYTSFLTKKDLTGKRIGWYTKPSNRHQGVDDLMQQAIADLKKLGAEIIVIDSILPSKVRFSSFELMLYEYKNGLNEYFKSLGKDALIQDISDLIEFNKRDEVELSFYGQEYLEMAITKGNLQDSTYLTALEIARIGSQDNGINRVMDTYNLDAIVAPTGSPAWETTHGKGDAFVLGSSSPAAISGYPNISLPMGNIDGLPVGVSIFGRKWSEAILIEIAYVYEQFTKHRITPKFLE